MRIKNCLIIGDSGSWTLNGTSVGGGTDSTTPWVSQLWSHQMVQQLDISQPNTKLRLVNRSYGGQSSNDLFRRVAGWSRFPIDVVILALGTNDCANNANPPSTTAGNLVNAVQRIRAWHGRNIPAVICVPWNEAEATRAPYLAAMQAGVAGVAATLGGATVTADWSSAWTVGGSAAFLQGDGLHPNSAGHAALATVTATALAAPTLGLF